MGITKRAQYKVFNGTDFDVINFESEADYQGIYRQALINGNFDVWQRGTVFNFAANVNPISPYTADRWYITKNWGDVYTITRQAFTAGQTTVPNNPKYFLRSTYNSGVGKAVNVVQKIEGLPFSGKTITISFWAKSNVANSLNILFEQYYSSGIEDGWSTKSVTLSTTWTQYTYTVNVASSAGKTIDDNVCASTVLLQCGFTNANDYVDIAQVQVNVGVTALPFAPKSYGDELKACQRYYQTGVFKFKAISSTRLLVLSSVLQTPMRIAGWGIMRYGSDINTPGNAFFYDNDTDANTGAVGFASKTSGECYFDGLVSSNAVFTAGHFYTVGMHLDAEL
jgi:hypothetical protein